jgi:hypothetical protein
MGKRVSKVRLIDSNFPILGLRPPRCCVYVAPLPAGSLDSLPFAYPAGFVYVARFPSAPLIDSRPAHQRSRAFPSIRLGSRRTYSRRERLPNEQAGDLEQSQNLISRASKPIKSRCAFRDRSLWRFLQ